VDIDLVGRDAIAKGIVHLEDARRDMEAITIPVTWIHAKHDAWVDLGRVRDILSCGDLSRRRLIEVPTGHQLRTSREALGTFQLIAGEVSRIALGRELAPAVPNPIVVQSRSVVERERIPRVTVDLQHFWRDYLLGRDGKIGLDLVTATDAYHAFLREQEVKLRLRDGDKVADLGSGTGSFLRLISKTVSPGQRIEIHAFDFVLAALARGKAESEAGGNSNAGRQYRIAADLNVSGVCGIPVRSGVYDAVLASLLVSYVVDSGSLLREAWRILRPGGRLVVSSMRRDSDISKLYVDSVQEMHAGKAREAFGSEIAREFDAVSRPFVNDAARLLEIEEAGRFRFWDPQELCAEVIRAGFEEVEFSLSLGNPPQAVIVCGRRS
jgi:ubiquinone/menaquinone biosynthesis C-methylase UbiE